MQRKFITQEPDFDFVTLRNEFEEAVRANHKKDKSIGNLTNMTNRSFSAVDLHKNSNLFTKILNFIPEETVANLFEIFKQEFETNKKSTMKEVNSLRLEISFEYKRKILEILLFLLFAIKHLTADNLSSRKLYKSKKKSQKLISRVHSFSLRGDQKILFQVNKTKSPNRNMSKDKEIVVENIIEEPKSVNLILNYTETNNKEVTWLKEKAQIVSTSENKLKTQFKNKDIPFESDKLNLSEKSPSKTVSFPEQNKEPGRSTSINKTSKVNESNINQKTNTEDVPNNRHLDKRANKDRANYVQMIDSSQILSQNPRKFPVFPDNNMSKTSNHNAMVSNEVGQRQFADPKYYHPNNMRFPFQHPYFFNYHNSDQMKINNTTDAYSYNNLIRMSYNHFMANPSVPLIRRQYNINMPPINHFSQSTYKNPEIARNYTEAYKTPQYQVMNNSMFNCNKVNTALINCGENSHPDKAITNVNPFYLGTDGNKKRDIESETVPNKTPQENTTRVSSGSNSNEFLKKKKKRDGAIKTSVTSLNNKADTSADRSSKIDLINICHNDEVQVKIFNEEIQNDCNLDCSTNEVDKSILLTSPNTLPNHDSSSSNDTGESFLTVTGMNISLTNSKEDEIVKKLVTIFNQRQFTTSSLESLRQILKLSEEKTNLIKEYLINKKYPKNQKDYIFLFKKEQEDKGLYLKIDAFKKMYSLIRHRIIKESDYK